MANFIEDALRSCVKYNRDGEFLVYGDRRVTWGELDDRANRVASALAKLGIGQGDKVVIMFHNCPQFFESNYAIQKLGAIPVPMNYRFAPREIAFQANHSEAKAFILEAEWLDHVQAARPDMPHVEHFILSSDTPRDDMADYESLMAAASGDFPVGETGLEDVCVLCYTGGTTGMPKGVMLTYGNHVRMVESIVKSVVPRLGGLEISPDMEQRLRQSVPGIAVSLAKSSVTRWVLGRPLLHRLMIGAALRGIGSPLAVRLASRRATKVMMPSFPMFHDAAYQLCILGPLFGNTTLVVPDGISFDPEQVMRLVERERPALLGNVPTAWRMLVEYADIDRFDKSSVMACATGAGVCPAALKRQIFERFPGVVIADGFGQTEMTPVTSFRFDTSPASLKDHCVGKPMVETRIVDDNHCDVARGEIGEIIYRSGSVMKGYYNEPDKTAEAVREGWLYSGDLGYFDEDGDLRIVERKKECISSGGEKIFPHEVEEILLEHPKIAQVCVIGVPDEKWGSSVRAVVALKQGQNLTAPEIIGFCEGKMAGYKKPRSVVFVDEMPISPVGKVQRRQVKENYGQSEAAVAAGS
ncbi:MAG: class I adenylate-forming enzyme family protein [Pseudomonadota bacterium]|nr:class I adenylate-forming enzyme family protein [Pseudomonadota bacterium]